MQAEETSQWIDVNRLLHACQEAWETMMINRGTGMAGQFAK